MIEIDTEKIRTAGNDIINLSNDYSSLISNEFLKISRMNRKDGEWSGTSAMRFITIANVDSKQYYKVGHIIKSYGRNLLDVADSIELLCQNIKYKK